MKIAFFETKGWEKNFLRKKLKGLHAEFHAEPLSIDNAGRFGGFDVVSVFIYSRVDGRVLKKLPRLRMVATRSTGFDHIDLEGCSRRKVAVSNVPSYGENTVAEHVFALILALSRKTHKAYLKTLRHDFSIEDLKGFDLKGKTLGVIGAGHIGLHVIRIAKGFDMKVLAFDTSQDKFLSEVLGFDYAGLDEVLGSSDIVTLHVPYNKNTHHMINRETLGKFKKGAVLINTARGGVVETEALIEGLDRGVLSGVGIDVLEGEELVKEEKQLLYDPGKIEVLGNLVKDHILLGKDNVVFTPHIAFYSQEALERILYTTVENITAYLSGSPRNVVNYPMAAS